MTAEPTKPKPRRRFWQYSLRTFFALVTMFCVWLGWTVHRANEQRTAVQWVRKMGGWVWYDYQLDKNGNEIVDAEPPGPKWLAPLLGADYFQEVPVVDLSRTKVSDLTLLAGLQNLQDLYLIDTPVSDVAPLAKLASLERLWLGNTQVSDPTSLANLTNLQFLSLSHQQVGEEQIKELQQALPNCTIQWWPPDPSP